jgi:uncharacterized protein with HEPN domain
VNHLNADFKAKHSNIPWRLIIGLRHRLAHDHNSIKVEVVHKVLDRPLQDLKELCNISLAFQ